MPFSASNGPFSSRVGYHFVYFYVEQSLRFDNGDNFLNNYI